MIGACWDVVALEGGGEVFGGFLTGDVDDGGEAVGVLEGFDEMGETVGGGERGGLIGEIGAVEGRLDAVGWGDGEGVADVCGGGWGGGGGEAEDWEWAEGGGDGGEAEVIRAEVVAPF